MKEFFKENRILLILILVIAIFFVASCVPVARRAMVEKQDKTYDVVLDYDELAMMAEQSDMSLEEWLKMFRDMGISKVGLTEESIITLMEDTDLDITGRMMDEVTKEAGWREDLPADFVKKIEDFGFDKYDILVEADGSEAKDFLKEGIHKRFAKERYVEFEEQDAAGKFYVLVNGASDEALYTDNYKYMNSKKGGFIERTDIVSSKIMYISLGLLPEKVKALQDAGMQIVPRTLAYNGWNDENYAKAVIAGYEKYGISPSYIIAGGEAVIGYDDGPEFASDYITKNNISIGLIENTTQLQNIMQYGVEEAAVASDFNTVRVFTVWNYIQYRYTYYGYSGAEEIENTLFRAVTERNIRLIYFKPFKYLKDNHTYVTNPEEYRAMFENLDARLAEHGFSFGQASVQKTLGASKALQMCTGLGAALAAVLLLALVLPVKKRGVVVLSALAVLAVLGAYVVMPNTAVLITSFASAVTFACLSVTFVTAMARFASEEAPAGIAGKDGEEAPLSKVLLYAALTLAAAVCISLAGGMMTASPLCSTPYMLEISIFRGVKLAQLLPIAFFALAYLAYFGFGNRKQHIGQLELLDIKDFCELKISIFMCMALGAVGLVGLYYIMRTGHDSSIEVSSAEMLFRNYLENHLLARPRTKEFLFAFPAVMMMVYCSSRRLKLLTLFFGLCSVVGLTSVVNTFMHIRTPLYLGFARTGYSLILGLAAGIIGIIVLDLLVKLYRKYFKEKVDRALNV